MFNYDDFYNWLRERAAVNRVFGPGQHPGGWTCNCPIASYAVEKLGMPSGRTAYSGSEIVMLNEGSSYWAALPDEQQPDELFHEFARRVDDACQDSMIPASTALAILEAVT